jgi:hypothetical protein
LISISRRLSLRCDSDPWTKLSMHRKMCCVFGVIGCVLAAGCSVGPDPIEHANIKQATKEYDLDVAGCRQSRPDDHAKPVTPRVECFSTANRKRASHGDRDYDLVDAMSAQMLRLAGSYDKGRMSAAMYDAKRADVFADFRSKALARETKAPVADGAKSQASAVRAAATRLVTCAQGTNTTYCY